MISQIPFNLDRKGGISRCRLEGDIPPKDTEQVSAQSRAVFANFAGREAEALALRPPMSSLTESVGNPLELTRNSSGVLLL